MANTWFRLYSEFAHDPKVQMLPEVMQRRLVMLMCLRSGNTLETLHETELAFFLRISEQELAATKRAFFDKGFIDEQWNIVNWEKRQFVSDSSTYRVQKHRAKKASTGGETPEKRSSNAPDTDTDTDTESKGSAKPSRTRATRLPENFAVTDDHRRFAHENALPSPDREIGAFCDYWRARPGAQGTKLDWNATFRNWLRRSVAMTSRPMAAPPRTIYATAGAQ